MVIAAPARPVCLSMVDGTVLHRTANYVGLAVARCSCSRWIVSMRLFFWTQPLLALSKIVALTMREP